MRRARLRDGESTSPPVTRRRAATCSVSSARVPSAKTRATVLSETPFWPSMLPIMSLFSTASMRQPSSSATRAMCRPPNSPCSSPESPA